MFNAEKWTAMSVGGAIVRFEPMPSTLTVGLSPPGSATTVAAPVTFSTFVAWFQVAMLVGDSQAGRNVQLSLPSCVMPLPAASTMNEFVAFTVNTYVPGEFVTDARFGTVKLVLSLVVGALDG